MKNVKDQVYAALDAVFENVTDQYPKDWAALPAVQYTEEDIKVYERTDKKRNPTFGTGLTSGTTGLLPKLPCR